MRFVTELRGGDQGVAGLGIVTRLATGDLYELDIEGVRRRNKLPTDCVVNACGRAAVDFFAANHWPGMNGVAIVPVCVEHSQSAYGDVYGIPEENAPEVAR